MADILEQIADALSSVDERVFYGVASKLPPGAPWDYIVFSRETTSAERNLTSVADRFEVAIVRENFVPEDMLDKIVAAMRTIPGMKHDSSQNVEYRYDIKPNTNDVVEMMLVYFTRGRK